MRVRTTWKSRNKSKAVAEKNYLHGVDERVGIEAAAKGMDEPRVCHHYILGRERRAWLDLDLMVETDRDKGD